MKIKGTGITIILLLILISQPTSGQGYSIGVRIHGLQKQTLQLAYHLGDKQYLRDSIVLNSSGYGKLEGVSPMPEGIYMIVLPGQSYFELLIGSDQIFEVECNIENPFGTLIFQGSEENQNFVEYQRNWVALNTKANSVRQRINSNRQNSDSLKVLERLNQRTDSEMKSYLKEVSSTNQGTLLALLVNAMLPVDIPDFDLPEGNFNIDSLQWVNSYVFNRDHFFDNINLGDERILRTPILQGKLNVYFKNLIIQAPDSLIVAVNHVLDRCESNYSVYQYVAVYLFNRFRESEIMGHDAVLVHLADKVYLSGKADWVTQDFRNDLKKQIDRIRPSLIGKKATDLIMNSYNNVFVSLYDIKADFTIVYFWEPDCGHCKEATPLLKQFYERNRDKGIEIFSVCTISDKEKWEKYIAENGLNWINGWDPDRLTHFDYYYNVTSTPLVYILNSKKEIIAKRLPVESIEEFLDNYRIYYSGK